MLRLLIYFSFVFTTSVIWTQERTIPADFRQHTLTQFNANLLNATHGLDWNNPNSFSIWTRWQWQTIDGDPTTLFANYSHKINQKSAIGIGFLQHNTGVYLNTGGNINYVYAIPLEDNIKLIFGANVFGFQEILADDRFVPDPDIDLPELESTNAFIVQFSPSARLQVNHFSLGITVENALDFNLSGNDGASTADRRVFTGTLSNDFLIGPFLGDADSFLRPVVYVRSIPDQDTQFGINGLFSTSKFWVQGGYNSFYGVSGGLGATISKQLSIGGLIEFGIDDILQDEKSTLELIASYHFGKTDDRKKVVGFDVEKDDGLALARINAEKEKQQQKEIADKKALDEREAKEKTKTEALRLEENKKAEEKKQQALIIEQQRKKDSIAQAKIEALKQEKAQKKLDSIAKLREQKVEVKANEKYEEVASAAGLEPGFYLIANVFGTKRYFESFMLTLKKKGLNPKSFYRSQNKFNYVYLERYDTMSEARKARDSKFFGNYPDKTWIFRVRGK